MTPTDLRIANISGENEVVSMEEARGKKNRPRLDSERTRAYPIP
jgi:hypothetical protein